MTAKNDQQHETHLYADDVRGVLFGVNNSKIVFASFEPDYSSEDDGDATYVRNVATMVIPTDSLLEFCLFTLKRFASQKGSLDTNMKSYVEGFGAQLAEIAEIDLFKSEEPSKPTKPAAKRKRASKTSE
ncbi:hypothetical protein WK57_02085 [Burkholderia ubonensis]|uniref:Uncharacterized protein n=1 Tax=Burkholderia ubonensis TaxID=101571 RepID=A0AA40RAZ9_9BURK|nr:hypothetical protein WK64_16780 [Burkholderia ubonensis]KWZ59477.1 hypothetical protein WK57_02085 [Burkholderia ubonensis]